jgi:hypothetical protein
MGLNQLKNYLKAIKQINQVDDQNIETAKLAKIKVYSIK